MTPAAYVSNPNGICLAEGQRRFRRYGSADLGSPLATRPPTSDEPLDPDWTPYPEPEGEKVRHDFLRDLGTLLLDKARQAGQEARHNNDPKSRGRLSAYREMVELLVAQGELFDLSRDDLGLPLGDLVSQELLADDPPLGHAAG